MAETFYFEIIASDKKFYSGACEHVIFPAVDGLYGVLANHEDTVTAVVAGELRFKVDGEWKVCVVGEGFADVTRDFVVIVVDKVTDYATHSFASSGREKSVGLSALVFRWRMLSERKAEALFEMKSSKFLKGRKTQGSMRLGQAPSP